MRKVVLKLLKNLSSEIESDLHQTEMFNNSISAFSPILWLESPNRKYVSTVRGICGIDPSSVLCYLSSQILSNVGMLLHNNNNTNTNIANQPFLTKKTLILCELIKLLPCFKEDENTSRHLSLLISLKYANPKTGLKNDQLIESIDYIINLASTNKLKVNDWKEYMNNISFNEIIRYFYHSIAGVNNFSNALLLIRNFFKKLNADVRSDAVLSAYNWISSFYNI